MLDEKASAVARTIHASENCQTCSPEQFERLIQGNFLTILSKRCRAMRLLHYLLRFGLDWANQQTLLGQTASLVAPLALAARYPHSFCKSPCVCVNQLLCRLRRIVVVVAVGASAAGFASCEREKFSQCVKKLNRSIAIAQLLPALEAAPGALVRCSATTQLTGTLVAAASMLASISGPWKRRKLAPSRTDSWLCANSGLRLLFGNGASHWGSAPMKFQLVMLLWLPRQALCMTRSDFCRPIYSKSIKKSRTQAPAWTGLLSRVTLAQHCG